MLRCKDIKRIVPRARMQEGIEKCKGNIADYLKDACIIAETGRLYHAIISLEFALEEFGKIVLLKETLDNDKSDALKIDGNEFCSHNRKVERALKILDPLQKYRVLFETVFERGVFVAGMWEGETVIGDRTRLDCAFVDFINNNWALGRNIKPAYFQDLVTLIQQGLEKV
jgi:AbiV family abortive infection protein